jgi:hypothetical protein
MEIIYKYTLDIEKRFVDIPASSKIIHVGNQGGKICLWASRDIDSTSEFMDTYTIVGTGSPYDEGVYNYVGTAIVPPFVWHVMLDRNG